MPEEVEPIYDNITKFQFHLYADGRNRRFTQGEDYHVTTRYFASQASKYAKQTGQKATWRYEPLEAEEPTAVCITFVKVGQPPEPEDEEHPTEYPHQEDGVGVTVLGPDVYLSSDRKHLNADGRSWVELGTLPANFDTRIAQALEHLVAAEEIARSMLPEVA